VGRRPRAETVERRRVTVVTIDAGNEASRVARLLTLLATGLERLMASHSALADPDHTVDLSAELSVHDTDHPRAIEGYR